MNKTEYSEQYISNGTNVFKNAYIETRRIKRNLQVKNFNHTPFGSEVWDVSHHEPVRPTVRSTKTAQNQKKDENEPSASLPPAIKASNTEIVPKCPIRPVSAAQRGIDLSNCYYKKITPNSPIFRRPPFANYGGGNNNKTCSDKKSHSLFVQPKIK
ncbi:hypothetical protein SNEBB_009110 [Seison nebaliae]|nr:hypothetical protein SNEBB_009110 [Seison nebaliae]